jgi:hypothetical protein
MEVICCKLLVGEDDFIVSFSKLSFRSRHVFLWFHLCLVDVLDSVDAHLIAFKSFVPFTLPLQLFECLDLFDVCFVVDIHFYLAFTLFQHLFSSSLGLPFSLAGALVG